MGARYLINISLQRGEVNAVTERNRFSGFPHPGKPLKWLASHRTPFHPVEALVITHILRCVSEAQFIAGRFGTNRYRFPLAVPVNPTGLPEGSRWSAGAGGGPPPERCANSRAPRRGARRYRACWPAGLLACAEGRLLASLRDANGSSPVNRWSFPPATLERPTGYPLPSLPGWTEVPAGWTPSSIRSAKAKPTELWVMTSAGAWC